MGEKVVSRKVLFRICGQWQLWQINSKTCKSYSKSKVNVGSVCSSCVLWSNQCDDSHLCLCSLVSLVSPGVLSIHILYLPPSLSLWDHCLLCVQWGCEYFCLPLFLCSWFSIFPQEFWILKIYSMHFEESLLHLAPACCLAQWQK